MPENYTPAAAATGTWTEEEIRHQPRAWIRSLTNIDALRSALNNFLEPLLRKENLRIILTGAGTSAFIGDIIAPWLASHTGKNFSAVPTTDLVTNPMDYLNPAHPLLLISFGRSGNSPESVAAVELANQFVPECYHLPITCNEAGALYQNAINSDNAFALLMPAETHDRGFAMTSSITTMMASCLAVFAPETINSQTFRDVADRCQAILTSLGDFSEGVFGYAPWKRIVYLGSGGLQGAARESALKVLELTAGKLAAFYDSPTGFRHGPKSLVDDETLANARQKGIEKYLWNDQQGWYADYDLKSHKVRNQLTAAALFPLYVNAAAKDRANKMATATKTHLLQPGGLNTTSVKSGQQWDAPNGWAPLQWVATEGLQNYGQKEVAMDISWHFLTNVQHTYDREKKLVEKYDVSTTGTGGGGGEYPLQDGFGWTNGVTLKMLDLICPKEQPCDNVPATRPTVKSATTQPSTKEAQPTP